MLEDRPLSSLAVEDFVAPPGVVVTAELGGDQRTGENERLVKGELLFHVGRVHSGAIPDPFRLEYEKATPDHEFRVTAWSDLQLTMGASYLLCVVPAATAARYVLASGILPTISELSTVDPLLLSAIPEIVARHQHQAAPTDSLRAANPYLQLYGVRQIVRQWEALQYPRDAAEFDGLQRALAAFVADAARPSSVRKRAIQEFGALDVVVREVWPTRLIETCLHLAQTDPDPDVRLLAVSSIGQMGSTKLGGIPKQTYEAAIAPLIALFLREPRGAVAKEIALAITQLGQRRHGVLLTGLAGLSPEKSFYVQAILDHWAREPMGGMEIATSSTEFDFVEGA